MIGVFSMQVYQCQFEGETTARSLFVLNQTPEDWKQSSQDVDRRECMSQTNTLLIQYKII